MIGRDVIEAVNVDYLYRLGLDDFVRHDLALMRIECRLSFLHFYLFA